MATRVRRNGTNGAPKKGRQRRTRLPAIVMPANATKARALRCYLDRGTVSGACQAANVGRRTWYHWLDADPAFAAGVLDAEEIVADELEAEAIQRAKSGSDTLLIFLLKTLRREKFSDRRELTVVSTEVRDRLVRQADVIVRALGVERAEALLVQLDEVWR